MSSAIIQLLVLAGIAVFLILRLRSVLGTRDGFEDPRSGSRGAPSRSRPEFDVIEGGPDRDITDHVADGSDAAKALAAMKMAEPGFSVAEFLQGSRQAYEMILTAFEAGDIDGVRNFMSEDVAQAFDGVIEARADQGLVVEADIVGVREVVLVDAAFDRGSSDGDVTVRFVGELASVVKNLDGDIVEGSASEIKRQRDVWTFSRNMGTDDPNWVLVATGD